MAQIQRLKKNGRSGLEKQTPQKTLFTSVLTIARELPHKNQKESWQDVPVNLSENIPTATETVTQKFSIIYLLGVSNHIFKLIFKTSQHPLVASLWWYVYFKDFFKKEHGFARLTFSVKKFQEIGTKSLFPSFQYSFSASYFPISQEQLD